MLGDLCHNFVCSASIVGLAVFSGLLQCRGIAVPITLGLAVIGRYVLGSIKRCVIAGEIV